jgi:sulfate/thiosulfate transport system substrate-binding protein
LAGVLGMGAGCGGADDGVTLVAYSTPREVYEELIPAFQRTPAGRGVSFRQSYGPSADQSRVVEQGLDADVLALSLAPDIDRLIDDGLIDAGWQNGSTEGFVSNSVVAFVVRPGNPKGLRTWDDLLRDDVEVITPNPLTSGGAQWNIAAAYGAQLREGRSPQEALDYLASLFRNVSVQPKGAREALQVFRAGKGDVLIAYENEAITARQKDEPVDYVIPDGNILIQNPIAVSTEAVDPEAALAFVDFALTADAQRIFAQKGYRPVNPEVMRDFRTMYPEPAGLFTIDGTLGGWERFREDFFSPGTGYMINIFAGRDPVVHGG